MNKKLGEQMNRSARWLLAASLLIVAPVAAQETSEDTTAEVSDTTATRVEALLSGIERVPTEDDWAKIGPPAVPELVRIMRDKSTKIVTRGRAAIGLGYFRVDAAREALRANLTDDSTPSLLLRKSMIALARIDGDASVALVEPHLAHRSKRVREQAIKTLGSLRSPGAREALGARAKIEPSRYLKDVIAAELAKPVKSTQSSTPTTASTSPPAATEAAQ